MAATEIEKLRTKARTQKDKLEQKLVALQERYRQEDDAGKADMRAELHELKQQVALAAEEYGELARTAATIAGGTNYRPPIGPT